MSNAYVIGHITVKDAEKWNEYRSQVPATLEPWGAELVLRGLVGPFNIGSEGSLA
jgi:uncharacterized protein (DUF1330 family)